VSVDHSAMKLGKRTPRVDPKTLRLGDYIIPGAPLPTPPASIDWDRVVPAGDWPMLGNDAAGDCTCAAAGHLIHAWTANSRAIPVVLDATKVLGEYSAITGYNPSDPSTDQGAVELDVLNHWRSHGFAGEQLAAYVAVSPRNHGHVRLALDLFGGVYVGLALPESAQRMNVWSVPAAGTHPGTPWGDGTPGSWGGHAVAVLAYDRLGLTCVTWGSLKRMTWSFWDTYCDEAYALLAPDWINAVGRAPSGFDVAALRADLARL
jgi:hypothetical protein